MSTLPPGSASIWARRVHEPFIAAALVVGLTTGFGYAALLVGSLALRIPAGAWWLAVVRAHGHAQLFGWMGLFIIGVGLFFLPRLRSITLRRSDLAPPAFWLLVSGITLYTLALPALALATATDPSSPFTFLARLLVAVGALLEFAALFPLAAMLLATERAAPPLVPGAPAYPVLGLIRLAAASLSAALAADALFALGEAGFLFVGPGGAWDSLIITLLLYGLAVPMAFVFAVRNLPLYLRLAPPPRAELRWLAVIYAAGLILRLSGPLAGFLDLDSSISNAAAALGVSIQSVCILWLIWRLDLLHRRPPWTVNRAPNTRPDLDHLRKPTRTKYPDRGEFGRFELLLYSAFGWLALSALMGLVRSLSFFGTGSFIPLDAERHALTVGFITLLIFGMAVRMVPGFSGKRRVASPSLVMATFVLGNLAAVLRVSPLFFPSLSASTALLGLSGAAGWLAVAALAVNVFQTFRLE